MLPGGVRRLCKAVNLSATGVFVRTAGLGLRKGQQVNLRLDRVDYWISKGAKPTDTLHSIIKRARRGATAAPAATDAAPAAAS